MIVKEKEMGLPTPKPGAGLMTIAFDLDGTLAEPTWPKPEIGRPIQKALDALLDYWAHGFEIIIFTSRPKSHLDAIMRWTRQNDLDNVVYDIITDKPRAAMYVDDRAVAFPEAFDGGLLNAERHIRGYAEGARGMSLPKDAKERKETPITTGVLDYFPDAIAEVARVSFVGNAQHNGANTPLHWAREKSTDHADCVARHLLERGTFDDDGTRHSAKTAWRALALLQTEIEASRG